MIGTKKSESGYETITGNIALNKTASASGVEAAMPNLTANLAVDGQKSDTSRWSAPTMKNGTSPNQQQTPQWLEIDLRNEVTNITSIDLYFYKLVYSIDYEIQTRADKKSEWKTVKHVTCQPGTVSESTVIASSAFTESIASFAFSGAGSVTSGVCT